MYSIAFSYRGCNRWSYGIANLDGNMNANVSSFNCLHDVLTYLQILFITINMCVVIDFKVNLEKET